MYTHSSTRVMWVLEKSNNVVTERIKDVLHALSNPRIPDALGSNLHERVEREPSEDEQEMNETWGSMCTLLSNVDGKDSDKCDCAETQVLTEQWLKIRSNAGLFFIPLKRFLKVMLQPLARGGGTISLLSSFCFVSHMQKMEHEIIEAISKK
ncbi:nicotinate-nucleotide adenylyltransferase, putative [Babesia ovis]|uniref:Nicotinate-nucleotide adenylyltransferase, putative n=1 Tax=Babesia ovis TaxID=5869 RepID=A0A9W5T891_BABOV|nr:nicotinate-nucleotide adenylyltransferase, putative [Babesia ovis]